MKYLAAAYVHLTQARCQPQKHASWPASSECPACTRQASGALQGGSHGCARFDGHAACRACALVILQLRARELMWVTVSFPRTRPAADITFLRESANPATRLPAPVYPNNITCRTMTCPRIHPRESTDCIRPFASRPHPPSMTG